MSLQVCSWHITGLVAEISDNLVGGTEVGAIFPRKNFKFIRTFHGAQLHNNGQKQTSEHIPTCCGTLQVPVGENCFSESDVEEC